MIDRLTASVPGFNFDALLERIRREGSADETIELAFDQHYGIRITVRGMWTEIQLREAGTWTAPVDTRELIGSRMLAR